MDKLTTKEEVAYVLSQRLVYDVNESKIIKSDNYEQETHDKWAKYGLLAGLEKEDAIKLAPYYEATAIILINHPHFKSESNTEEINYVNLNYETLIFPALRRTYVLGGVTNDNLADIINDFYYFLLGYQKTDISDTDESLIFKDIYFDALADMTRLFSHMMAAKYNEEYGEDDE